VDETARNPGIDCEITSHDPADPMPAAIVRVDDVQLHPDPIARYELRDDRVGYPGCMGTCDVLDTRQERGIECWPEPAGLVDMEGR
jgi:hypothetical protein